MKCPKCGHEMIKGIYDYGAGNAYCECLICEDCNYTEVPPLVKAIGGSETTWATTETRIRRN